jgi:hypothetical protein
MHLYFDESRDFASLLTAMTSTCRPGCLDLRVLNSGPLSLVGQATDTAVMTAAQLGDYRQER